MSRFDGFSLNNNLRPLKRVDAGFTFESKTVNEPLRMCDSCVMWRDCKVLKAVKKMQSKDGVAADILVCPHYVPPLFFVDTAGLSESVMVNTFRLGKAWENRVRPSDRVALMKVGGEFIRFATVVAVFAIPKDVAIANHSSWNHTFRLRSLSNEEAAAEMRCLLPKLVGPLIYRHATHITVIEFK